MNSSFIKFLKSSVIKGTWTKESLNNDISLKSSYQQYFYFHLFEFFTSGLNLLLVIFGICVYLYKLCTSTNEILIKNPYEHFFILIYYCEIIYKCFECVISYLLLINIIFFGLLILKKIFLKKIQILLKIGYYFWIGFVLNHESFIKEILCENKIFFYLKKIISFLIFYINIFSSCFIDWVKFDIL
jgi:hypothetical protein